jgi:hypothetical protein
MSSRVFRSMENMQNRIAEAVIALIVGLVLGVVGTFGHRGVIGVHAANLPWGIVVALLAVACLFAGVRLYTGSRLATLAAVVGVLVPIFVFSFQGPGGSVVIVQDTLGRLWAYGPLVLAVLTLALPAPRARTAAQH